MLSHMNNSNSNNNPNKSIKTFDFKTLYTTIPHNKFKEAIELFVRDVFGYNLIPKCINRLLVYIWEQNCAPYLANIFLRGYEKECIDSSVTF